MGKLMRCCRYHPPISKAPLYDSSQSFCLTVSGMLFANAAGISFVVLASLLYHLLLAIR